MDFVKIVPFIWPLLLACLTNVAHTSQASEQECELAKEYAVRSLERARLGTAVSLNMLRLRKIQKICGFQLNTFKTSEEELSELELRGIRELYFNGLAALKSGVNVKENFFENLGVKLEFDKTRIEQDRALALSTRKPMHLDKQNCTPKDLRDKMPPIRNQDSIGWCYACVTADLFSFKLGKNISCADIALQYNRKFVRIFPYRPGKDEPNLEVAENGMVADAVNDTYRKGGRICEEKYVSLEDYRFSKEYSALSKNLRDIVKLKIAFDKLKNEKKKSAVCKEDRETIQRVFPGLNIDNLIPILSRAIAPNELPQEIAKNSCPEPIKPPHLDLVKIEGSNQINLINEQLDKNNIISIDYNFSSLMDPGNSSLASLPHASSIVGRQWNEENQSCDFLIRNSHGTTCNYSEHFVCESGNIWVPSSYLNSYISRGNYFK